jgi:hypothetical protein
MKQWLGASLSTLNFLLPGLAAVMLWLLTSVGTEALGGLANSFPTMFDDPSLDAWLDGMAIWFESGGGIGVAMALLASSVIDLFRPNAPTRGHLVLAIVGVIGLFAAAAFAYHIVHREPGSHTAKELSVIIVAFTLVVGSGTAFANSWAERPRQDKQRPVPVPHAKASPDEAAR